MSIHRYDGRRIRWGILGTGMIAEKFAKELPLSKTGHLQAVASRSNEKAKAFLGRLHSQILPESGASFAQAHDNYEALVTDPDVDAVYIALPNSLHRDWTLRALRARKHVLCEKPLALHALEAEEMFAAAKSANRILMEATMYRALPQTRLLIDAVASGQIGIPKLLRTNFTFTRPVDPNDARYQPGAGGGSLMDVGCYCIDLARSIAGDEPVESHAVFHQHESGVDDYAAGTLRFPSGLLATFTCGMTVVSDQTTHIAGSEARIEIPRFWFGAEGFKIVYPNGDHSVFPGNRPDTTPIYAIEADAFAAVLEGSPSWNPPENTIGNLCVIDRLRGM